MLILGVSTSTPSGSVALLEDDRLLAEIVYEGGHGEGLFGALDAAFAASGRSKRELGLIGCDVGPGSFTGVRAGVAAMQAVSMALGVPCVAVGSLEAMVERAHALGHWAVLALLDAKKEEAYFGLYIDGEEPRVSHVPLSALADVGELRDAHQAVVIGELAARFGGFDPLRDTATDLPRAEQVGRVAFRRGVGAASSVLEPVYVRAPDAKLPAR